MWKHIIAKSICYKGENRSANKYVNRKGKSQKGRSKEAISLFIFLCSNNTNTHWIQSAI